MPTHGRLMSVFTVAAMQLVAACAGDSPITDCSILESLDAEERV